MNWYVYIIQAEGDSYYTGISTDVEKRFLEHKNGQGAKFFNLRRPIKVVHIEANHTRSSASKREAEIKKLSHDEKRALINTKFS